MKIKLFIAYLFTIISTYANSTDKLCINFAKILLGLEPNKHIACVYRISYNSTKEIPSSKYKYIEAPNLSRFNSASLPLVNVAVLTSYCKFIDSIIFIEKMYYSLQNRPLPLLDKTKWLVVLESPYKDGSVIGNRILNERQIKLLSEFKFINTETFFLIPYPQLENGVCLQWDKDLFKIPSNIIQEQPTLANDIAIMSSVLCAKQIDISNVNILENLYDIKSKLQTKLGIKIYTEVCNILEANLIKSEFLPNKNSTLDFNEIERKLNKIK